MDLFYQIAVGLLTVIAAIYATYTSSQGKKEDERRLNFKDVPPMILEERMTITPLTPPTYYKSQMPMVHHGKSTAFLATLQQLQDDVDCKKLIEDAEAKAEAEWKEEMNAPI